MRRPTAEVASFLLVSGACALIYQIAWLRELRLIFGSSTPACAVVLAVFMGGLGYGALRLGARAQTHDRPLKLYAQLELGIALLAGLSPLLLTLVRELYVALGGSGTMGTVLGTVARIVLAAIVLVPATFLMGGTLPAAARAVTHTQDRDRRVTALIYGLNTLGAVFGVALASFVLLEHLGTRATIWSTSGVNLALALVAWFVGARGRPVPAVSRADQDAAELARASPRAHKLVLLAAAAVGFVFLQMELVWYRMLSPLLGGSSYTFALILAVALFGVGCGGLLYTLRSRQIPVRWSTLAALCALEAFCLALPLALGDRIALLAALAYPMAALGMAGRVGVWLTISAVVVLPAAIVAGYQFPVLIALLGRGREALGLDVGRAYAFNTIGAILGSLAGGFLLIPGLGAVLVWRLCVAALIGLAWTIVAARWRSESWSAARCVALVMGFAAALAIALATGPTAFWRHSPIGAGRAASLIPDMTTNGVRAAMQERRRAVSWEREGRETSVGMQTLSDTGLLANGKSDGAAVVDAGTQVMGGLLGALLEPAPIRRALVIGLGTGSTAGWLAQLPEIEQVDVFELEPAVLEVARQCGPTNANALDNPKIRIHIGDARELVLTSSETYDLIFSEPSNPFRAGVASLFTREFYTALHARLSSDGIFMQWMQIYEIDAPSLAAIYATLSAEFAAVESWQTMHSDLVLISRGAARPIDVDLLAQRIAQAPYAEALMAAWRVDSVEGVLARHVAGPAMARAVAAARGDLAVVTDDRNELEFALARTVGRSQDLDIDQLRELAARTGSARPQLRGSRAAQVDWSAVTDAYLSMWLVELTRPRTARTLAGDKERSHRVQAVDAWLSDQPRAVLAAWQKQNKMPADAAELMLLADSFAQVGDRERTRALVSMLEPRTPIEAAVIRAKLEWAQRDPGAAWKQLGPALRAHREHPWANARLMASSLRLATQIAVASPEHAGEVLDELSFARPVHQLDSMRIDLWFELALHLQRAEECVRALAAYTVHIPWQRQFLERRVRCLELAKHADLARARGDLAGFLANESPGFATYLEL